MCATEQELLTEAIRNYENDKMELAIQQFSALTKSDNEEAFLYLSLIYKDGDGVSKDELLAKKYKIRYVEIIKSKAVLGDEKYKLKYAYILQYGDGIPIDCEAAISIFNNLADLGCAEAQYHLYCIFNYGWCDQNKDNVLALEWLNKATKSNWPDAMYSTARILLNGSCVGDYVANDAKLLLEKAAESGHWPSIEALRLYFSNIT